MPGCLVHKYTVIAAVIVAFIVFVAIVLIVKAVVGYTHAHGHEDHYVGLDMRHIQYQGETLPLPLPISISPGIR